MISLIHAEGAKSPSEAVKPATVANPTSRKDVTPGETMTDEASIVHNPVSLLPEDTIMEFWNDDFSLEQLFLMSDAIGDKYLTPEEIANRDAKLLEARVELWNTLTDEDLDYVSEIG